MNQIEILVKQTEDAYNWTNKLINSFPKQTWNTVPEVVESSVTWHVGHLIVSHYYHSVMVIVGHQKDILGNIPMKEYDSLFTQGSADAAQGMTNPEELSEQLAFIQKRSVEILKTLSPNDLESKLEPVNPPHPIANTKFEALDWNIKHAMWHCGQLGMLKRVISERFDFGLRK